MTKCKYILYGIFLSLVSIGCSVVQNGIDYPSSFITNYCVPQNLKIISSDSLGIVKFQYEGKNVYSGKLFDHLSEYNEDNTYHGLNHDIIGLRHALSSCITEMSVTTILDFDNLHPSGSDISELMECIFLSYSNYIENGYKENMDDQDYEHMKNIFKQYGINVNYGGQLQVKKVSEISCENSDIAYPRDWILVFNSKPQTPGNYPFILSVQTEGKDLSITFQMTFR